MSLRVGLLLDTALAKPVKAGKTVDWFGRLHIKEDKLERRERSLVGDLADLLEHSGEPRPTPENPRPGKPDEDDDDNNGGVIQVVDGSDTTEQRRAYCTYLPARIGVERGVLGHQPDWPYRDLTYPASALYDGILPR
jgi:hypothetical protein